MGIRLLERRIRQQPVIPTTLGGRADVTSGRGRGIRAGYPENVVPLAGLHAARAATARCPPATGHVRTGTRGCAARRRSSEGGVALSSSGCRRYQRWSRCTPMQRGQFLPQASACRCSDELRARVAVSARCVGARVPYGHLRRHPSRGSRTQCPAGAVPAVSRTPRNDRHAGRSHLHGDHRLGCARGAPS
jgi:hypothetical protein